MDSGRLKKTLLADIMLLFALLLLFLISLKVSNDVILREHARVQQALDSACGPGFVSESEGKYSTDPVFNWSSPKASCFEDLVEQKLVCKCLDSTPAR